MKLVFVFLILFLCLGNIFSYNGKIDSLQIAIKSSKEDTSQVNILNALSLEYLNSGKYDSALVYAQQGLKLSESLLFYKGTSVALKTIGLTYYYQSVYTKALEYFFLSLKIAEKYNYKLVMASDYGNIGNIFFLLKDDAKAILYYEKTAKIFEEIGNKPAMATTLGNIGNVYNHLENYQKALSYYFNSVKTREEINEAETAGNAVVLGNIGVIYKKKKEYDKALDFHFRALEISKKSGFKYGIAGAYDNIGDTYILLKRYREGEAYLKMSLVVANEIHSLDMIEKINNSLSDLYAEQNKWQLALVYYKDHVLYKDSIYNETNSKQIAEMQTKYETEKKDNELFLLKAEKQIDENKKYFLIAISSLFFLLIVVLCLLILLLINRQKKQKETSYIKQQLIQSELEKSELKTENLEAMLHINQEKLNEFTKQIIEKTELLDKLQLQNSNDLKLEEKSIQKLFKTIEEYIAPDEYWEKFITTFNLVHTVFFDALLAEFPSLTSAELRLCALIKCNLGNKEIANVLKINASSVKTACNRLGKKMELKEENLRQFILTRG